MLMQPVRCRCSRQDAYTAQVSTRKRSVRQNTHRVILLNRGTLFASQWKEFSLPLSSAHRLLQCYHSQWEIGDAAIPPQPPAFTVISQWARRLEWRHDVTLHILVGKICISFFLFYCEDMLSVVVLWLCENTSPPFFY